MHQTSEGRIADEDLLHTYYAGLCWRNPRQPKRLGTDMTYLGRALTHHEQKRLGGMIVLLEQERPDGDELCERLLDVPNAELNGKPLRWATDNRTWYEFLGGSAASEFLPSFNKLAENTASEPDFPTIAKAIKLILERGKCIAPVEQLRVDTFDYAKIHGCYVWIWELKPIELSKTVACRNCGVVYDFASRAGLVSGSALVDMFLNGGRPVDLDPSSVKRPDADMFMESVSPEHRGVPPDILEWLRSGNHRRWWCQKCRREQGYPGSLFRTST